MGSIDYDSDTEFYGNYNEAKKSLLSLGWIEGKPSRDGDVITTTFTKDDYSIFIMYGCREDIDHEVL